MNTHREKERENVRCGKRSNESERGIDRGMESKTRRNKERKR